MYERKSNDVCSCEPRRSSSWQNTTRVFCSLSLKAALRQPASDLGPQLQGLPLASSVDDDVIAIALEPDGRVLPGHPPIERVVQHHVGEQG